MRVVAMFDPPLAMQQLREWRDQNQELLARIPEEAIRIDVGRTVDGDFARVKIEEAYAAGFGPPAQGA